MECIGFGFAVISFNFIYVVIIWCKYVDFVHNHHCPIANRIQWLFRFFCSFFCSRESIFVFFFYSHCEITWNLYGSTNTELLNSVCIWITDETNDFLPFPYNICAAYIVRCIIIWESRIIVLQTIMAQDQTCSWISTCAVAADVSFACNLLTRVCMCVEKIFFFQHHWITNENVELKLLNWSKQNN